MLTEELIEKAKSGDLGVLAELDANGFLIASNENSETFAKRLQTLLEKREDLIKQVQNKEFYEIEGMKFKSKGMIPKKDFANSCRQTKELYGFSIDWVPGFYQNPSFGWLFGGCCYTSEPDFFSFFQIRESFRAKSRWLFYNRDELMAHELCHVARSGMSAVKFEEFFAYQTSAKKFRKICGSVLYSSFDTLLILIGAISMPVAQYLNLSGTLNLPLWPFILFFVGVVSNLVRRYFSLQNQYEAAIVNLSPVFGENAKSVLFRCEDSEIQEFAKKTTGEVTEIVRKRVEETVRWKVIDKRFGAGATEEVSVEGIEEVAL